MEILPQQAASVFRLGWRLSDDMEWDMHIDELTKERESIIQADAKASHRDWKDLAAAAFCGRGEDGPFDFEARRADGYHARYAARWPLQAGGQGSVDVLLCLVKKIKGILNSFIFNSANIRQNKGFDILVDESSTSGNILRAAKQEHASFEFNISFISSFMCTIYSERFIMSAKPLFS